MSNALTERRRRRRHQLSEEVRVVDKVNNLTLGQLVNIHQEGLLIMGMPLNLNSSHQVTLLLPNSINHQTEFELGIECLWSQQIDPAEDIHWSGCSIIEMSKVAEQCVQSMINIRS